MESWKAGTKTLIELHGTLAHVKCQSCSFTMQRSEFQETLTSMNPQWHHLIEKRNFTKDLKEDGQSQPVSTVRPDGDVEIDLDYSAFQYPSCPNCGGGARSQEKSPPSSFKYSPGILKPDVIFFGENISSEVKQECNNQIELAKGILVMGTTLTTYSSYRLVRDAHLMGKPIWCINRGATRAEEFFQHKVEDACEHTLPMLVDGLHSK
jgi:NAD-dependent SIR2 family protein deacetylase